MKKYLRLLPYIERIGFFKFGVQCTNLQNKYFNDLLSGNKLSTLVGEHKGLPMWIANKYATGFYIPLYKVITFIKKIK